MKPTRLSLRALLLSVALAGSAVPAHALEIQVANNAPYTIDDQDHSGFLLEVVKKIETELKLDIPVKFTGWKDVQANARAGQNILFFPYSRTAEREPNYLWVQKLWDIDEVFASKAGSAAINSYEEGKTLSAVGVVAGSTGNAELAKRGFTNLKLFNNAVAMTEALAKGEVSAAYSADIEMKYAWKTAHYPGAIVIGNTLAKRALYIAASKDSPQIKPADWAQAFAAVQKSGAIDQAYQRYFGQR